MGYFKEKFRHRFYRLASMMLNVNDLIEFLVVNFISSNNPPLHSLSATSTLVELLAEPCSGRKNNNADSIQQLWDI